jgi:hypothetical protein
MYRLQSQMPYGVKMLEGPSKVPPTYVISSLKQPRENLWHRYIRHPIRSYVITSEGHFLRPSRTRCRHKSLESEIIHQIYRERL